MERKTILLALAAAGVLAIGGLAFASAGNGAGDDEEDDADERLDVTLAQGESHRIEATSADAVSGVEAGYEMKNTGSSAATVTVTLTGPDGAVIDSRTVDVPAGGSKEVEIEHAFDGTGEAGTYTVAITADAGSVHLTEGEVEFGLDD